MKIKFHDSIAARLIIYVTVVILLVGAFVLSVNTYYAADKARIDTTNTIDALITTVEPHLEVATYLNDTILAETIAKGLTANTIVASVKIVANSIELPNQEITLATLQLDSSIESNQSTLIRRNIVSPFSEGESTGYVEILRNSHQVDDLVSREIVNAGLPVLTLTIVIAVAMITLVRMVLMPFLDQFFGRLNAISAEHNELMTCDQKHQENEVGVLVHYINRMLERFYDIQARERDLHHKNEVERKKLETILEKANNGIFLMQSDGEVQSKNPAFEHMLSSMPNENDDSCDDKDGNFFSFLESEQKSLTQHIKRSISQGESVEHDIFVTNSAGQSRWLHLTLSPIEDQLFQGVLNDITEHKESLIEAQNIAKTDALTGLANRYAFDEYLEKEAVAVAEKRNKGFALMFIDLDHFKPVNDLHGHDAGDHVLRVVAKRLRESVRSNDFISRFGGDEFVVILHGVEDVTIVESVAQSIIKNLGYTILFEGETNLQIGASIGIAIMKPDMNINKEILLQNADEAMYKVKEDGRGSYFINENDYSSSSREPSRGQNNKSLH